MFVLKTFTEHLFSLDIFGRAVKYISSSSPITIFYQLYVMDSTYFTLTRLSFYLCIPNHNCVKLLHHN